jgi:protocatechuate 3,4-dioxygenase beta subunit
MIRVAVLALCLAVTSIDATAQIPGTPTPGAPGGGAQRPGLPGGRLQQPPRDPRDTPTGTSVIRGRVVAADGGAAIRRVHVRAMAAEHRESRMASTDAQGRYELRDLPAGRWQLSASKAGYITLQYGQRRAFESGRPIELGEDETMARADFALPRGAAVTGRVMDEFGDPVAGARVVVMRYQSFQGQRRLVPTGFGDQTDDTGAYRVYGIAPGDYYVSATMQDRAFSDDTGDSTGYAPTYYPGTGNVAEAQRVSIALGQEITNITFALLPTRTIRITGTVIDSRGEPLTNGFVMLQESFESAGPGMMMMMRGGGRVRPDGSFTISNVSPGSYTLMVQTVPGPDGEGASVPITVGNEDLSGINLVTSKGGVVSGRVVAAQGSTGSLPVSGLQVFAQPVRFEPMMGFAPARVESDGTFRVTGVRGRRLFRVNGLPPSWVLHSVRLNGTDVTDSGVEFKGDGSEEGLEILLTDRVSEINGKVTSEKGEPTREYTVIVFPDDSAKWTFPSRYVRAARADQGGLFKIRGLPPEDRYLAVAVDYLEEGEGGDPHFLEQIKDRATRVSLGEGEVKALDLKLITR